MKLESRAPAAGGKCHPSGRCHGWLRHSSRSDGQLVVLLGDA